MNHIQKKVRVLVVGQTPPPFGGQAVMIEKMVNAHFDTIEMIHLRMAFSRSVNEIGRFGWSKIIHLISLMVRGTKMLVLRRIDVLYYFPAGPMFIPVVRDILLLFIWRIFAPKLIYHFQASGISDLLKSKHFWFRGLARLAYGRPDAAISLSLLNPNDANYFKAKKVYVIPNAVEDHYRGRNRPRSSTEVALLYMGILSEEKGIFALLQAFSHLCAEGFNLSLHMAGEFDSEKTRLDFLKELNGSLIQSKVWLHGLITGEEKWKLYESVDILCFLSYFRAEASPIVVLEAMMCELPVLSTLWRGIPDLVIDNHNGYLVPVRDTKETVEKLRMLVRDPSLRDEFGKNGRARYLKEFTIENHLSKLETAILETVKD